MTAESLEESGYERAVARVAGAEAMAADAQDKNERLRAQLAVATRDRSTIEFRLRAHYHAACLSLRSEVKRCWQQEAPAVLAAMDPVAAASAELLLERALDRAGHDHDLDVLADAQGTVGLGLGLQAD